MTYGLWLSAGGLQINEYRQSLAANNMANVDTVGFKRDFAVFHERQVESRIDGMQQPYSDRLLDRLSGGTWVKPTYTSFEQGGLEDTGRSLDLALFGDGFFTVSDGDAVRYTRDGRFVWNSTDELVLASGDGKHRVLDDSGNPIVLADPLLGEVFIGQDGTLHQDDTAIAKLGLADFDDRTMLRKIGSSLFENVGQESPGSAKVEVRSGFVERSTVSPISGLANMIEVTRAYELNARMISLQDDTLAQAVTRVGRIA